MDFLLGVLCLISSVDVDLKIGFKESEIYVFFSFVISSLEFLFSICYIL